MSTVFRVEKNANFTVMANYHLKDRRLSYKAKGLLSEMLSLPPDWDYTLSGLAVIAAENPADNPDYIPDDNSGNSAVENTVENAGNGFVKGKSPSLENPVTVGKSVKKQIFLDNPLSGKPLPTNPLSENPTTATYKKLNKQELNIHQSNHEYDYLVQNQSNPKLRINLGKVNEIISVMVDVICSTKKTIRVNGEELPQEVVKKRFLELDGEHIDYVLTALETSAGEIRNIRAYLITALYNAPETIDNYYAEWVRRDMGR